MNLSAAGKALAEAAWIVFLIGLVLAISGACFFAIGYLLHLGWVAW